MPALENALSFPLFSLSLLSLLSLPLLPIQTRNYAQAVVPEHQLQLPRARAFARGPPGAPPVPEQRRREAGNRRRGSGPDVGRPELRAGRRRESPGELHEPGPDVVLWVIFFLVRREGERRGEREDVSGERRRRKTAERRERTVAASFRAPSASHLFSMRSWRGCRILGSGSGKGRR